MNRNSFLVLDAVVVVLVSKPQIRDSLPVVFNLSFTVSVDIFTQAGFKALFGFYKCVKKVTCHLPDHFQ